MLAAQEHGVDSTPAVNQVMYPDLIRAEMPIPDALLILIGVALGYRDPDDSRDSYRTTRRSLEDVVRFWGRKLTSAVRCPRQTSGMQV